MVILSAQYPRFGYRRIQVFLERQGHAMSADGVWRLWRQAKLQVPRKRPRHRVASGRPRPMAPTGANQVWAYDFVFDACANGQQLKCLRPPAVHGCGRQPAPCASLPSIRHLHPPQATSSKSASPDSQGRRRSPARRRVCSYLPPPAGPRPPWRQRLRQITTTGLPSSALPPNVHA